MQKKFFLLLIGLWNRQKKLMIYQGENFLNIGVGGFIDLPKKDKYKSGFNFLFISREFVPKGGHCGCKGIYRS